MIRHIGVNLHINSFTVCYLSDGGKERIQALLLWGGGLEQFIAGLDRADEVAVEATGNSILFREQVLPHVGRVAIIAPWQFEVIRRSVKKTYKHDACAIAFFLSKDMLLEARLKDTALVQLTGTIATRDQLVKLRVSLLNKVHAFYEHIKSTRGVGKAIIATARKPLNTIFGTLKTNGYLRTLQNSNLKLEYNHRRKRR